MRCPYCTAGEDKVIDSRLAEEGRTIRRRRECLSCNRRYTTFERPEEVPLIVTKRSGEEEPFARVKVIEGITRACKNRPVTQAEIAALGEDVEESMRARGVRQISSSDLGRAVLDRLRNLDEVAYIRFASVYKDFQEIDDFEREGLLLKHTSVSSESEPR